MEDKRIHASYKETKNLIHNELGITKEEILDIIKLEISNAVREEINKVLGEEGEKIKSNIYPAMKDIVEKNMLEAITAKNYPKVLDGVYFYDNYKDHTFENFIIDAMKKELVDKLFDKFNVSLKVEEN